MLFLVSCMNTKGDITSLSKKKIKIKSYSASQVVEHFIHLNTKK